jgi:hypothetical protein
MTSPDLFAHAESRGIRTPRNDTAARKRRTRIPFTVYDTDGSTRTITPAGRDSWALGELILAGADGCTPIDQPGPRWSGYVHKLRHRYGLNVETINEQHGGEFAGHHARYVLHSRVTFADPADAAHMEGSRHVS